MLIHKAYLNKNAVVFEHYVDLDSIYSNAFDDGVFASLNEIGKSDKSNSFSDTLVFGLAQMVKPAFVKSAKDATIKGVKGETITGSDSFVPLYDLLFKEIRRAVENSEITLKEYKELSKFDTTCVVELLFFNKKTSKDFSFKVKMDRLSDGKWKVVKLENLNDSLSTVSDKVNKKEILGKTDNTAVDDISKKKLNEEVMEVSLEKKRETSNFVRKQLLEADKISGENGVTTYTFSSKKPERAVNAKLTDSISVRHMFFVNEKTNEVTDAVMFIMIKDKSISSDFDTICFSVGSDIKYTINVNEWEKSKKGFKKSLPLSDTGIDYIKSDAFASKLSFMSDAYKSLSSNGTPTISFFGKGELISCYDLNNDTYASILESYLLYQVLQKNLKNKDGKTYLL